LAAGRSDGTPSMPSETPAEPIPNAALKRFSCRRQQRGDLHKLLVGEVLPAEREQLVVAYMGVRITATA
jgi:hypothetical protein